MKNKQQIKINPLAFETALSNIKVTQEQKLYYIYGKDGVILIKAFGADKDEVSLTGFSADFTGDFFFKVTPDYLFDFLSVIDKTQNINLFFQDCESALLFMAKNIIEVISPVRIISNGETFDIESELKIDNIEKVLQSYSKPTSVKIENKEESIEQEQQEELQEVA